MTIKDDRRVAVIGAGLGGASAAVLLQNAGYDVSLYEQAPKFERLGAGIHLSPNCTHVLEAMGVLDDILSFAVETDAWVSRDACSGEATARLDLKGMARERWGAPYITVHRGDVHAAIVDAIASSRINFGKQLLGYQANSNGTITLDFTDGSSAETDILIGADGAFSTVRKDLVGTEEPGYVGVVGHRAIIPASAIPSNEYDHACKWWGEDRHMMVYYTRNSFDEIYFVSGVPESDWPHEARWVPCGVDEVLADFDGFHSDVADLIKASPSCTKWAFYGAAPLEKWSEGPVVLLGDACHPMKPHMGQGAVMAIEDAAILARSFEMAPTDHEAAFGIYERARLARTAQVQEVSYANDWLRYAVDDVDWCYGYNPVTTKLK